MPIKGISDIRRLPRVGKVRLGERATSQRGSQYPRAVDYFVVKADDVTSEAAARAFRQVYGDKPRELRIMFPTDDPDQFFPQFYKAYKQGVGLWCRGDGERAQRVGENGELVEVDCPCDLLEQGLCKRIGNLQFLLPDVPVIGVWQLDTSSFHSMVNLNSSIALIKTMTGGRIQGIPLTLRLRPQEVSPDGRKKTVYVLELVLEGWTIPQLVKAARMPTPAFLAPPIDHDEIPEDLYPADLVNSVKGALPEPETQGEESNDFEEGVIGDEEPEPAPDEGLMAELEEAARQLGWTPSRLEANIQAARAKGISEEELLRRMRAKIEQMQGAQEQSTPTPQEAPKTAQTASLAVNGRRRRVF